MNILIKPFQNMNMNQTQSSNQNSKINFISFIVGVTFALGLGLSGMTQPQKVKGFLDIFGMWDPSLVFVMIGAILLHFVTYKIIRRQKTPLYSAYWHVPTKTEITPSLVIGAVLFGVGWGLAGFCPGPAITSLATLQPKVILFVSSMFIGMFLFKLLDKKIKFRR